MDFRLELREGAMCPTQLRLWSFRKWESHWQSRDAGSHGCCWGEGRVGLVRPVGTALTHPALSDVCPRPCHAAVSQTMRFPGHISL